MVNQKGFILQSAWDKKKKDSFFLGNLVSKDILADKYEAIPQGVRTEKSRGDSQMLHITKGVCLGESFTGVRNLLRSGFPQSFASCQLCQT